MRCGEEPPGSGWARSPSPGERTPPTPAGDTLLLNLGCAWLRQCEHTIIHYNSITVIKAGGMQRREGVLPANLHSVSSARDNSG